MIRILKFLLLLIVALNAYATIGTNDYGYGLVSKSMGGTGVAEPQNAFLCP